jgi:hypothetical protein
MLVPMVILAARLCRHRGLSRRLHVHGLKGVADALGLDYGPHPHGTLCPDVGQHHPGGHPFPGVFC